MGFESGSERTSNTAQGPAAPAGFLLRRVPEYRRIGVAIAP